MRIADLEMAIVNAYANEDCDLLMMIANRLVDCADEFALRKIEEILP